MSGNQSRAQEASHRLDRFEAFLKADPENSRLLADAFHAALQCGEWERARGHLNHAQALQPGDAAWVLREGDFWLAQRRFDEARKVLGQLAQLAEPGTPFGAVVAHNLAFIDFELGAYADCIQKLEPWVSEVAPQGDASMSDVQQLWLRALHRAGELERACEWAAKHEQSGTLHPAAAGVAALAAIDHEDVAAAQRWTLMAFNGPQAPTMEALASRATLALAGRDAKGAQQWADEALKLNPRDGRAWSARAFASLLTGDLATAAHDFKQAVAFMPEHVGTWHGQGWTHVLLNDILQARASFEAALARDRNFAESHGGLAVVLALQKQAHSAQEHIELALRLDKNSLSARYAQILLSGEARDAQIVQRLARHLLGARKAPLGESMADWLPQPAGPKK